MGLLLLSVVLKELQIKIECVHPSQKLGLTKAGSYPTNMTADARMGSISLGDLYAEEERDFGVTFKVPVDGSRTETTILKVRCFTTILRAYLPKKKGGGTEKGKKR